MSERRRKNNLSTEIGPQVISIKIKRTVNNLSVSKFSILLIVLRYWQDLLDACIKSQQGLSKKELDMGVTSRSFWKTFVAPAYKDASIHPSVQFPDYIQANISLAFDGNQKTGEELEASKKFKVSMNSIMNRYAAFVQNSSKWHSFLLAGGSDPSSIYPQNCSWIASCLTLVYQTIIQIF